MMRIDAVAGPDLSRRDFPSATVPNGSVADQNSIPAASATGVSLSFSPEAQKMLAAKSGSKPGQSESSPSQPKESSETYNRSGKPVSKTPAGEELTDSQQQQVESLRLRDIHVKMHEAQHMAASGGYARGGPSYTYSTGPDGKPYAVGGEVLIDTSPVADNPEATIRKAQIIRAGALAPADPSGADRSVAAGATQMENEARAELQKKQSPGNPDKTSQPDTRTNPAQESSSITGSPRQATVQPGTSDRKPQNGSRESAFIQAYRNAMPQKNSAGSLLNLLA